MRMMIIILCTWTIFLSESHTPGVFFKCQSLLLVVVLVGCHHSHNVDHSVYTYVSMCVCMCVYVYARVYVCML